MDPLDPTAQDETPRRRRPSRYLRAQERRDAQKAADQKFYRVIFGLASFGVMIVLAVIALAYSMGSGVGGSDFEMPARETVFGLTVLEWIAMVVIAVAAFFMWRRINKR